MSSVKVSFLSCLLKINQNLEILLSSLVNIPILIDFYTLTSQEKETIELGSSLSYVQIRIQM